ncbi:MAG: hypothetical protein C0487_08640 [Leptothrix sp. (in: Bacteria)]|nr:hypothetical protein [Leptothrix sp. (in: b-proteobacteria)]
MPITQSFGNVLHFQVRLHQQRLGISGAGQVQQFKVAGPFITQAPPQGARGQAQRLCHVVKARVAAITQGQQLLHQVGHPRAGLR